MPTKNTLSYSYQGRTVRVIFFSRIARLGGENNCITLSRHTIRVSNGWIDCRTLSHEFGHIEQAYRYGLWYLPWVLWGYLWHGYTNAPAEQEAERFMDAHYQNFTDLGLNLLSP